jgi:hypothetical protein
LPPELGLVGQLSGLGDAPEIFEPPPRRPDFLNGLFIESLSKLSLQNAISETANLKLLGQPLFIMPGAHY